MSSSRARRTGMGTIGWKPSGAVRLGTAWLSTLRGGLSMSMQRRMREWQKKIVILRRIKMKSMWISCPMSLFVRAMPRSKLLSAKC